MALDRDKRANGVTTTWIPTVVERGETMFPQEDLVFGAPGENDGQKHAEVAVVTLL